jgi:hypothetical protein
MDYSFEGLRRKAVSPLPDVRLPFDPLISHLLLIHTCIHILLGEVRSMAFLCRIFLPVFRSLSLVVSSIGGAKAERKMDSLAW